MMLTCCTNWSGKQTRETKYIQKCELHTERRDEAPVNTEDTYFPLGDGMIKFFHRSITCSNTLVNYSKKSALVM